ncbi:Endoplasmic reticulum membrane protein 65 [Colletotrichum sp. SAR 10_65]|nr:Endoplasmic reticulum membrane protein 65 [Colletotrichum sp. SAR 10_65]KAJ4998957.1 Endoplasmic reticulum membrane protein 65 [Colletotrichum sp. SAR 10_66]
MAEGEHRVREAEDHASSGDTAAEPVEAFPAMPAFPSDGLPLDRNVVDTKSDIRVSHIPMPPLPSVSASAPPTSTLPTIPGGHSDEEQSSDASSTHSKPELQESSNSSSISEPATAVEKKDAEHKEGAEQKTRARAGSSSASMKKNQSHDNDGIKLYVIYNVLEVGDRLLSALGQDIFECLFSSETLSRNSSGRSKVLLPMGMFVLALVYNVIHSVSLYYQVITLNVAVNSYSNALLTLMISNQFVEIKSTVFKRFEKDNLFQLTCADIVERFQLWIMLLIIGMRNIVEVGGLSVPGAGSESGSDMGGGAMPLHSPSILPFSFTVLPSWVWSGEVLSPFLIVIGSEMLVDTIKHAYVNKFNNIKPTFYSRILDILCKDYYTNAFVTPSLTRRLGLAVIPLSCLFIRASVQTYHMFLSTRIPTPLPESTQTSLSVESATPSSPVMVAALDRLDTLLRDALGRAVYGYPYASPGVKARSWWSWTSDDVIAAVTMIVVFFIAFLVLLVIKLLLGMILLRYSRNRYAKMKRKEHLVATGQEERESYDAKGKRVGGYGHIEVTEDRRRWIHADEKEGLKGGKGRVQKAEKPPESDYNGVYRYNQIWDLYFSGKRFVAFTMAEDLVREPGLCADHEAGMHQLLTCHPLNDDTIMHAQEVVRIDSEIVQKYHDTATMHEQAFMQTKLRFAKEHLQLVLEKKRKLDEEIAFWMSVEFVKVDAQDTQPKQAEQGEQAQRPAVPEDDNNLGDMLPLSPTTAADDELLRSSQNAPSDTTRRTDESS